MLTLEHAERLLVIAFLLLLFGCVAPFLMVLEVVQSTMFLNLVSFASSTLGLFLGFIGTAMLRARRHKNSDDDDMRR